MILLHGECGSSQATSYVLCLFYFSLMSKTEIVNVCMLSSECFLLLIAFLLIFSHTVSYESWKWEPLVFRVHYFVKMADSATHFLLFILSCLGQVQWLMPVIPVVWETKAGESPEVGSSRPAWTTWRNPVSTKNTKLAGCGGRYL